MNKSLTQEEFNLINILKLLKEFSGNNTKKVEEANNKLEKINDDQLVSFLLKALLIGTIQNNKILDNLYSSIVISLKNIFI